jgi:hypothetical protein
MQYSKCFKGILQGTRWGLLMKITIGEESRDIVHVFWFQIREDIRKRT